MRKIEKGEEPESLRTFKRARAHDCYDDLSDVHRRDIRAACTAEQYFLCAYCCQAISGENGDTMNEHVEARNLAPQRSLDFNNIVASCTAPRQCDAAHGSQPLLLTPLMDACEQDLRFKLSGRVEGRTQDAREAIRVLNLGDVEINNKALIEKRKQLVDALIWKHYESDANQLELEDDRELFELLQSELSAPREGKLEPFAPVLLNILREWAAVI